MAGNGVPDGAKQRGPRRGKARSKPKGSLLPSTSPRFPLDWVHKASGRETLLREQRRNCGIQPCREQKGLLPALEHGQIRGREVFTLHKVCLPSAVRVGLDVIPLGKGSRAQE